MNEEHTVVDSPCAEVLCTVLEHAGATYAKPGLRVRIAADGTMSSMLNGGCFDADLLEQAAAVREAGRARVLVYDARDPADAIYGSGSGCRGAITVLAEPAPLEGSALSAWMASLGSGRPGPGLAVTRIVGALVHGAEVAVQRVHLVSASGEVIVASQLDAEERESLASLPATGGAELLHKVDGASSLIEKASVPLRLLVLGGGRDAEPVVALAGTLGWRVVVLDHRPARVAHELFPAAEAVHLGRPPREPASGASSRSTPMAYSPAPGVDNTRHAFDAALVMTHNLALDGDALAWLAAGDVPFIGLLGPAERRDRLLAGLGAFTPRLEGRLYAPVGLHLGGRSPETIALSIVAQLQAHHAGASGGPLSSQSQRLTNGTSADRHSVGEAR